MRSPQKPKEVQNLNGQIAALSRFISRATNKSLPFFNVLKQGKKFQWSSECEEGFQALKKHLEETYLLSKPQPEDGSSGEAGSRAGIVLESPEGHKLNCAVRFGFKASNNAVEYEALLAGFRLAREMQVRRLVASSDSQLIMNQVSGSVAAKDSSMVVYLKLVLDLIPQFERFELIQVSRLENTHTDALSKLGSSKDSELLKIVPIEHLSKPSISGGEEVLWIEGTPLWMQPIIAYLKDQTLFASRSEARKLRRRAAHFVLKEDMLYKRGFASPLL
ncbi:uncharacterized protein LOC111388718 [Olea europaea var. sylvestris]|uniref:uncharacterized protein LOC111388718 n=1 Tax=Olea europaea var. sylvestris TaxID=158386 RepID=UPI000C1CE0AE|nr:uncharacterized protein LOC111388718 [Olea europaea var. sylvestris]